jgi:hypothetical protein
MNTRTIQVIQMVDETMSMLDRWIDDVIEYLDNEIKIKKFEIIHLKRNKNGKTN